MSPTEDSLPERSAAAQRRLRRKLLEWFAIEKRALPWRESRDPYRVWISEAMLQQTRVEAVIGYYERFLDALPALSDLAAASEEQVLGLWSGLGYYSRARKLREAAGEIVERFAGEFPRTREEALSLAGVGPYTAGAVLSIAYDLPEALVDGNVQRVFARLFALHDEAGSTSMQKKLWELARALVPRKGGAGDWNQALMELGATCCTPRTPRCEVCPVRSDCRALELGLVADLPRPKPRKAPTAVQLEILVARKGTKLLLEQRPPKGRMAGLWQFPTFELGPGDALFPALDCAQRKSLRAGPSFGDLRHSITRYAIRAELHTAQVVGELPASSRWFGPAELEGAPLTGMARKTLRLLESSAP